MANVTAKSEGGHVHLVDDSDSMDDITQRSNLAEYEHGMGDGIDSELRFKNNRKDILNHEDNSPVGGSNKSDNHPILQHVVSVTGCSITFKIEITGLTYVFDSDIIKPCVNISKDDALYWLGLLGYKEDNLFEIDNETKELNESNSYNCSIDSGDFHNNLSSMIRDTGNVQSNELDFCVDKLDKDCQKLDDSDIIEIKHEKLSDHNARNIMHRANTSHSEVIHQFDKPAIRHESAECAVSDDVVAMDTSMPEDDVQDGVSTTAHLHGYSKSNAHAAEGNYSSESHEQATPSSHLARQNVTNSDDKTFTCEMCTFTSNEAHSFQLHLQQHFPNDLLLCHLCMYTPVNQRDLEQHFLTHTDGMQLLKCERCTFCTASAADFDLHTKNHTKSDLLTCDQCTYTASLKGDFERHKRIHTNYKPYKCDICTYTCRQSYNLKRHMLTHETDKPFTCSKPTCDYKTADRSYLKRHEITHTKIRPQNCPLCPFTSNRASNLTVHLRTHTKAHPHHCDYCPYTTVQLAHLKLHIKRKHSGECEASESFSPISTDCHVYPKHSSEASESFNPISTDCHVHPKCSTEASGSVTKISDSTDCNEYPKPTL